jgi:hypothetical protein
MGIGARHGGMMAPMAGTDRLTVGGFLARFAFALLVVGATYKRLTLRPIGGIGLLLANAFLAALFWLFADWGWLPIENVAAISWIGLFSVTTILAVGMSLSHLRRARATTPS